MTKNRPSPAAQRRKFMEAARQAAADHNVEIDDVVRRLAAQEKPADRRLKGRKPKSQDER